MFAYNYYIGLCYASKHTVLCIQMSSPTNQRSKLIDSIMTILVCKLVIIENNPPIYLVVDVTRGYVVLAGFKVATSWSSVLLLKYTTTRRGDASTFELLHVFIKYRSNGRDACAIDNTTSE